MNRVAVLTEIADRYVELACPAGISGIAGSGDGYPRPASTYTPTVKEFERLMVRLRGERHHLWWHVNEHHIRAERRTIWRCPRCKKLTHKAAHTHQDGHGRPYSVDGQRIITVHRHRNANPAKAAKGILQLADWWVLPFEPMIPSELLVAA